MEKLSTTIVEEAVTTELQQEGQTVDQIGAGVEERVQERTDELTEQFGEGIQEIAGEAMAEAQSYHQDRNALFDPHAKVADLSSQSAAGITEMQSRTVTMHSAAMEFEMQDTGYWERVSGHEEIHQNHQAGSYNATEIVFIGDDGSMQTTEVDALIEWQPSSQANKPEDLTPEYQGFVEEGEKLAAVVGKNRIEQALKNGNISALQDEILEKQRERIAEPLVMRG